MESKNINCLLVFVDDTGHEELVQPKFPVFGFGGCAVIGSLYESIIKQPWLSLKSLSFGDSSKALHACNWNDYNPEQKEAIGSFFRMQQFSRFGVVLKNTTILPTEFLRYQIVFGVLEERLRRIVEISEVKNVSVTFESSQRTDRLAKKYSSKWKFLNRRQQQVCVERHFISKSTQEPGLEVADFTINPAGRRACERSKGINIVEKRFQCVFQDVAKELVSFVELDAINYAQRPQTLPTDLQDWTFNVGNLDAHKNS
jgi:hypothetical protein